MLEVLVFTANQLTNINHSQNYTISQQLSCCSDGCTILHNWNSKKMGWVNFREKL